MIALKKIDFSLKNIIILFCLISGFVYISFENYLLFHSSIELFSIIIAFNIFIIVLNTLHISQNNYFVFMGIVYGFIAFFDLVHVFAYKGMGIFVEHGANLPTQLWIISRYIESFSLVIAFLFLNKDYLNKYKVLFIYSSISILLLLSLFYWGIFPDCYLAGSGLTGFKVISEYIISGLLIGGIILLRYNKEKMNYNMYRFMLRALVTTVLAELSFTFYIDVYGLSNMLGHLFKLASFYFIYKAVNETVLKKPYESLFDKLNREKDKLQKYLDITEVIFLILDKNGDIKSINKKGCEILGYKKENVLGKNWFDNFVKTEDRKEVKKNFEKVKAGTKKLAENFENEVVTRDGNYKTIMWHNAVLKKEAGKVQEILSSGMDITERKKAEEKIKNMSYYDDLTGLYNRRFYEEELKRLNTDRQLPLSIIIGDVNKLKLTNDIFGHITGDELLKKAANAINDSVREEDIVARWGGDEFGIILPQTDKKEIQDIMARIKQNCRSSDFEPVPLVISLGSAIKEKSKTEIKGLFTEAEKKMYQNKLKYEDLQSNPFLEALLNKLKAPIKGHAMRIIDLAEKMGKKLNLPDNKIKDLFLLAKFHDIGKIAVSNEILGKKGSLNQEELQEFKRHSEIGCKIARNFQSLMPIANYILYHHENWNGKGYPQGIKGEDIPLLARIVHIIDAYDALTNEIYYPIDENVYYDSSLSKQEAIEELKKLSGKLFDPELVEKFIELIK